MDSTVSTRRGNGSVWLPLVGARAGSGSRTPFGIWELSLRNDNAAEAQQIKDWLEQAVIVDILLIISYVGQTPPWPT